jgi:hypothetical protein
LYVFVTNIREVFDWDVTIFFPTFSKQMVIENRYDLVGILGILAMEPVFTAFISRMVFYKRYNTLVKFNTFVDFVVVLVLVRSTNDFTY